MKTKIIIITSLFLILASLFVEAAEKLYVFPETLSPSGKYRIGFVPLYPKTPIGSRVYLLTKKGKILSSCVTDYDLLKDDDLQSDLKTTADWNKGETIVAISPHARFWSAVAFFIRRNSKIIPLPAPTWEEPFDQIIPNSEERENGELIGHFIEFSKWTGKDTCTVHFFGSTFVKGQERPVNYSFTVTLRISTKGIKVLKTVNGDD